MATHYSILAWKIPWVEEPGRLQTRDHKELHMTEQLHLMCNVISIHLNLKVQS